MAANLAGLMFLPYYRHIMEILETDKSLKSTAKGELFSPICHFLSTVLAILGYIHHRSASLDLVTLCRSAYYLWSAPLVTGDPSSFSHPKLTTAIIFWSLLHHPILYPCTHKFHMGAGWNLHSHSAMIWIDYSCICLCQILTWSLFHRIMADWIKICHNRALFH